jgi:hypothetical protein
MKEHLTQYTRQILTALLLCMLVMPVVVYAQAHDPYQVADSVQVNQTVAEPPAPPPGGGGGGPIPDDDEPFGPTLLSITDIDIEESETSAVVSWTTTLSALSTLAWGETEHYELGIISGTEEQEEHSFFIENLTPGTQYVIALTAETVSGKKAQSSGILFRTKRLPDMQPPANVSDFEARYDEEDEEVVLSWQNPSDEDFSRVRIIRSDIFYPKDPYDGIVVYEGKKEHASDAWIEEGTPYYYTAFSEDETGNYSSGAIAYAEIPGDDDGDDEDADDEETYSFLGPAVIYPEGAETPEVIDELTFEDFLFFQGEEEAERRGSLIFIEGELHTTIALPYDEVPEVLKTITLVFEDPNDASKKFPFLLRVNADKSAYTATIGTLPEIGIYTVRAFVLDYKHQVLKEMEGRVIVPGVMQSAHWSTWMCEYCRPPFSVLRLLHCYGWIPLLIIAIIIRMIQRGKKKRRRFRLGGRNDPKAQ